MTKMTRRTMLLGLGFAASGFGCGMNPFLIPSLLTNENRESIVPAEYPLKAHAGKKADVRVVVLASSAPGLHPDLAGVDRMLNIQLIETLETQAKHNEEKLQVLKIQFIDKFKADNTNWRRMNPYDVGVEHQADYVIDVEIGEMELFKPGSRGEFLQGRASLSVTAFDLSKPLKDPAYRSEVTLQYPRISEIPVESRSRTEVSNFRMEYVRRLAMAVALKFTAAPADYRRHLD